MKTLVLGLGNPILTDDGVGIHVVRLVAARLGDDPSFSDVACAEASVGGLRLLEVIAGYDRVIMVDAIRTGAGRAGDLYRLGPGNLQRSLHSGSSHDLTLSGALALGRGLGMALPEDDDILIWAIEAEDLFTFGEVCTPAVEAAIPNAVDAVVTELLRS